MALFNKVVQILVFPDFDGRLPGSIDRLQGGQIGTTFVHGDRLGGAVLVDGFLEVATRCSLVAVGTHEKVDGLALSTARYRYFQPPLTLI
jgi:hypothetical protein